MNSGLFTLEGGADTKRPAVAGPDRLCSGGFVALRQPVAVAFLFQRQVSLYPLLCVPLLIIHPVLFQHHGQSQPEHFQAEHISVPVGLHIGQIRVIEIFTVVTRDDTGIPYKPPVGLRQHFQIAAKIKRRVSIALDAERLIGVLL